MHDSSPLKYSTRCLIHEGKSRHLWIPLRHLLANHTGVKVIRLLPPSTNYNHHKYCVDQQVNEIETKEEEAIGYHWMSCLQLW